MPRTVKTSIGELSDAIKEQLTVYSKEITDGIKKAVDDTSEDLLKNIRKDAPVRTGEYKKALTVKTMYEDAFEKRNRWSGGKEYPLTHLLEDGHKIFKGVAKGEKNQVQVHTRGGTVRAFPHIRKNEETARKEFDRKVDEIIKNAGH